MSHYHLYAIGNALVDAEYDVSDEQLQTMGVDKRHMTLIDGERRSELLRQVQGLQHRRNGGGSAGNTVVALAQLGGKAFYSCKVADDELGAFYTQDLNDKGVATNLNHTRALPGQTGNCMVLVTPDAERSMCTFLGATAELEASALHPHRQMARDAGVALAVTLSDVSMINFCRDGLTAMIGDGLDYLFGNEEEAQVWCDSQDMAQIIRTLSPLAKVVCLTRGPQGCLVIENGQATQVAAPVVKAVDTNGAGDMFAGAFLYAATHGYSHAQAADLANRAAAAVVSQHGNRLSMQTLLPIKQAFEQAHAR